jgi:hypothetical protein
MLTSLKQHSFRTDSLASTFQLREKPAMRHAPLLAALLLISVSHPTWAQSPTDHQGHHPDQKEAPAAKPATPPDNQGSMSRSQGMTGQNMGGPGTMNGPGTMSGPGTMGGGMMNMMGGGRMPMMDMMQMMGMMRQGGDGTETIDRVEGRIAFLRAELKITEAQATAWNAFADTLRANAKTLGELRSSMMSEQRGTQSLTDRLATQEKWLAARLDGTRAMKTALAGLIGTFSDEQKKSADELLAPHMGMMQTMSGMRGGGMGMMMQPNKPEQ